MSKKDVQILADRLREASEALARAEAVFKIVETDLPERVADRLRSVYVLQERVLELAKYARGLEG